jgi:hypothetical protein
LAAEDRWTGGDVAGGEDQIDVALWREGVRRVHTL